MEPDTKPAPQTERPLAERLIKYLPIFIISHALVTIPTFVISLALAYATFVQADATRKIQTSETWPYVSFGTSNSNPDGKLEIRFDLTNYGVGPAQLEAMQFLYKGRAMSNPREFVSKCCAGDAQFTFTTEPVTGVLRPGAQTNFIRVAKTDQNAQIWDRLDKERWNIVVQTCYCSIFDECWISDNRQKRPKAVNTCPADWTTFDERPFPGTSGESQAGF